jgi:hypothetical protein
MLRMVPLPRYAGENFFSGACLEDAAAGYFFVP